MSCKKREKKEKIYFLFVLTSLIFMARMEVEGKKPTLLRVGGPLAVEGS